MLLTPRFFPLNGINFDLEGFFALGINPSFCYLLQTAGGLFDQPRGD